MSTPNKPSAPLRLGKAFDDIYRTEADGIHSFRMLIRGRWAQPADGKTRAVRTPIDGSVIARVPQASMKDVDEAVEFAHQNRQRIRDIPAIERIELFEEAKRLIEQSREDFERVLTLEAGKPAREAKGEVKATMERLRLTMEEARKIFGEYIPGDWAEDTMGKFALVIREPIGVVAAIAPFNYPLYIGVAKIAPALLAGNAVVVKPSSETPLAMLLFARVLEKAGFPEGSISVLTGPGDAVGNRLVAHERVGCVTFTGSTAVGRGMVSVAGVKRLHLELGGKAPAIVLEDADLELAAKKCVEGALKNAGQRCDAVSLVLAVRPVAGRFVELAVREAKGWRHGDPREPDVVMGPLINEAAAWRVHSLVEDAVSRGARLLLGGKPEGCYYPPTVLDHVPLEARIVWEETFGPVLPVVRVADEDEAIEVANRSKYGLDSCVFTNGFYRMWKVAKRLQVGEVAINDFPRHGVGYFPFGGVKESGIGREGIGYSIDEMTNLKTIVFNLEPARLGKLRRAYKM